jgi:hypothetical protein
MSNELEEAISLRAYHLWETAGRPDGRDQEFWHRAEAELRPREPPNEKPPIIHGGYQP